MNNIQKELMKKHGLTDWKYISIATKSEDTRKRLLELGFVEPLKESVKFEGGCWNLYYTTQNQQEFINVQNVIKNDDFDYVGMETCPMAKADYIGYLEGMSDPRD